MNKEIFLEKLKKLEKLESIVAIDISNLDKVFLQKVLNIKYSIDNQDRYMIYNTKFGIDNVVFTKSLFNELLIDYVIKLKGDK